MAENMMARLGKKKRIPMPQIQTLKMYLRMKADVSANHVGGRTYCPVDNK